MKSKLELQCPICDAWVNQVDWVQHGHDAHKETWVAVIRLSRSMDHVVFRYSYHLPAINKTWNGSRIAKVRFVSARKAA